TVGEIYKDDLEDPEEALTTFSEFLRRYPHNRLADQARQAVADLKQEAASPQKSAAQRDAEKYQRAADAVSPAAKASTIEAKSDRDSDDEENAQPTAAADSKSDKFPRVTSIRHWSTPDYTRVAIDVEQDVKFTSQRIGDPDRIFFDLYSTMLASTLVG